MVHAQLDEHYICIGYSNLSGIVTHWSVVYLPNGWDEDLRWRKYLDGTWSAEKFLPPAPEPGTSPEEQIASLKQRLAATEQSAADTSLTLQELIESLYV